MTRWCNWTVGVWCLMCRCACHRAKGTPPVMPHGVCHRCQATGLHCAPLTSLPNTFLNDNCRPDRLLTTLWNPVPSNKSVQSPFSKARAFGEHHPFRQPGMERRGSQWVRFASPQSAPTAPASGVFIALSSVCQIMFSESACPSVQWLGSGASPPFSTVPGQRSLVGLWECKHSARLKNLCLVDCRVGPYLYWARGVHAGQGHQQEGTCCCWPHSATPSPCLGGLLPLTVYNLRFTKCGTPTPEPTRTQMKMVFLESAQRGGPEKSSWALAFIENCWQPFWTQ